MQFNPTSEDEIAQAITRLVDGTLAAGEREAVEAWAAASPDVSRQVSVQRRVVQQLATDGPAPPERLLAAIDARVGERGRARPAAAQAGPRTARSRAPAARPRGNWFGGLAAGAFAAAAAVVAVVVVAAGGSSSPSIDAAARLAFVPSTAPAPHAANTHYLDVSYGGVTFPNYGRLGAVATGQLSNRIGGRRALTVYYRLRDGARLSYTVFSGTPVGLPKAARLVRFEGVPLRVYRMRDGLSVVTLVRSGRTCVLAAHTVEDVVLGLAAEPVLVQRV
jgi:hypothetical protein